MAEPEGTSPVPGPLVLPQDEFAALKRAARTLAKIVAGQRRAMEAARIEMAQGDAGKAMQWILNSLPDVWDDPETEWDGRESAGEWWDRTEPFYRAAEGCGCSPLGPCTPDIEPWDAEPAPASPEGAAGVTAPAEGIRGRLEAALDASIDRCARCKVCDTQIGAAMTVLGPLLERAEAAEAKVAAVRAYCSERASSYLDAGSRQTVAGVFAAIGSEDGGHD